MSKQWNQHIGDDQLVYGTPKHMSAVAGKSEKYAGPDGLKTYWRYKPKPHACDKCQATKGLWFEENPGPVHPNCKCEIEKFETFRIAGLTDAIIVPPGVDLAANIAEARRVAKECEARAQEKVAPFADDYRAKEAEKLIALLYKCEWIIEKFQSGADYDYKAVNGKHPEYTDFGNYHYGLYTNAMGVNATFAQVGAGYYQLKKKTSEWWNPKWIINYFDDPRDNRRIREGQQYPLD